MDFLGGLEGLFSGALELMESILSKTPEEIAEFCNREGIPAREVMALVNVGTKAMREESESLDPKEMFCGVVGYLENNDFIYDEDLRLFREK